MTVENAAAARRETHAAPAYFTLRAHHHAAPGERFFLPAAPRQPHHLRDLFLLGAALACIVVFAAQVTAQPTPGHPATPHAHP